MNDEADEEAEVTWDTIKKLLDYYGHWYQFVVYIFIEIFINFFRNYSGYLVGDWAQDQKKQDETIPFRI